MGLSRNAVGNRWSGDDFIVGHVRGTVASTIVVASGVTTMLGVLLAMTEHAVLECESRNGQIVVKSNAKMCLMNLPS